MSDKKQIVVLGAGIGGLAVGYFLAKTGRYRVTVIEKESGVGGMCSSFEHDGFTLDYGAHKLYSVIPGILGEIKNLMGDRLLRLSKKNKLFLRRHLLDYPLRFGNLAQALGPAAFLRLGLGYATVLLEGILRGGESRSYEEYIVKRFGRPAYELVFEPLADKVWGDPSSLHPEMARTRVPASGGLEVILKLLQIKKDTAETNAEFFYYPRKGFREFPIALQERIEAMGGKVIVNADVKELRQENIKVTSVACAVKGKTEHFPCDILISSIPLQDLGQILFHGADNEFNRAVSDLEFRHLILAYIFVNRPLALKDQWIFFPEKDVIFSRIFEQKQMNPDLGPEDKTAICCDFTCSEESWQWKASDEKLAHECIEGLVKSGFIESSEVSSFIVKRKRSFYPRYDLRYEDKMKRMLREIRQVENLLLTGRIGMYNYNNADHCMDMGRFISDRLIEDTPCPQLLSELEEHVKSYRIVD